MTIMATVLDLPRHKVILGQSWLRTVNPRMDWKRERMVIRANKTNLVFVPLSSDMRSHTLSSRSCAPMSDQNEKPQSRGESFSWEEALQPGVEYTNGDEMSCGVSLSRESLTEIQGKSTFSKSEKMISKEALSLLLPPLPPLRHSLSLISAQQISNIARKNDPGDEFFMLMAIETSSSNVVNPSLYLFWSPFKTCFLKK